MLSVAFGAACGGPAGGDAEAGDAEAGDAAPAGAASERSDGGPETPLDAGRLDAGRSDAAPTDAGPPDAGPRCTDVHDGFSCETEGEVCTTPEVRCTCRRGGSGSAWFCESADCPLDIDRREACETPGLRCGRRFEDGGFHCVAPENVWVRCRQWSYDEVAGLFLHCPPEPPTEGAVCCIDSYLDRIGEPEPCPYDDGSQYLCRDHHWARVD
jgi:hypothetical protein